MSNTRGHGKITNRSKVRKEHWVKIDEVENGRVNGRNFWSSTTGGPIS